MVKNDLKNWISILIPSVLYILSNIILSSVLPFDFSKEKAGCVIAIPLVCIYLLCKKNHKRNHGDKKSYAAYILFFTSIFISLMIVSAFIFRKPEKISSFPEFISIVFIAPVSEEIIFRYMTFEKCRDIMKIIPSVIVSSLLFAAGHVNICNVLISFLTGILLSAIYIGTSSIIFPVILHSFANFILSYNGIYNLPHTIYMASSMYIVFSIIFILITFKKQFLSIKRRK